MAKLFDLDGETVVTNPATVKGVGSGRCEYTHRVCRVATVVVAGHETVCGLGVLRKYFENIANADELPAMVKAASTRKPRRTRLKAAGRKAKTS